MSDRGDGSRVLGEASGVQIVERGSELLVVDLGTTWAYTFGFVAILVSVIAGLNGVFQLALSVSGGPGLPGLGVALIAFGIGGGFAVRAIVRYVRGRRTAPLVSLPVIAIFDREHRQLRNGAGHPIAWLDHVVVGRAFQFTSSAPALKAQFPGGTLLIAKGHPFAGGVYELEDALRAGGIRVGK